MTDPIRRFNKEELRQWEQLERLGEQKLYAEFARAMGHQVILLEREADEEPFLAEAGKKRLDPEFVELKKTICARWSVFSDRVKLDTRDLVAAFMGGCIADVMGWSWQAVMPAVVLLGRVAGYNLAKWCSKDDGAKRENEAPGSSESPM